MRHLYQGGLVLLALVSAAVVMLPGITQAHVRQGNECCRHCRRARPQCRCARYVPMAIDDCPQANPCPVVPPVVGPPVSITQTAVRPVVQTHYVPRTVRTTRQVQETHYRNEQYMECVPTTTVECVTVDEGCYQMVWVPKPVTKQVPKTVMTQRVACRSVPYTVTRCVPECTTQCVPVQTVRYISETTRVPCVTTPYAAASPVPMQDPNCSAPVGGAPGATPTLNGNNPTPVPDPKPVSLGTPNFGNSPETLSRATTDTRTGTASPSAAAVWRTRGVPAR